MAYASVCGFTHGDVGFSARSLDRLAASFPSHPRSMDVTATVKCRLSLCESPQKRSMKLVWGLNLWRMAKLREFNQACIWNALGGLTPEFRVISELLGHLRRSAIGREGGPVELADHQRCRAADTLELVHDRLSERHVEDARLHPTYDLSPGPVNIPASISTQRSYSGCHWPA
jgi:hypothetical protein